MRVSHRPRDVVSAVGENSVHMREKELHLGIVSAPKKSDWITAMHVLDCLMHLGKRLHHARVQRRLFSVRTGCCRRKPPKFVFKIFELVKVHPSGIHQAEIVDLFIV